MDILFLLLSISWARFSFTALLLAGGKVLAFSSSIRLVSQFYARGQLKIFFCPRAKKLRMENSLYSYCEYIWTNYAILYYTIGSFDFLFIICKECLSSSVGKTLSLVYARHRVLVPIATAMIQFALFRGDKRKDLKKNNL